MANDIAADPGDHFSVGRRQLARFFRDLLLDFPETNIRINYACAFKKMRPALCTVRDRRVIVPDVVIVGAEEEFVVGSFEDVLEVSERDCGGGHGHLDHVGRPLLVDVVDHLGLVLGATLGSVRTRKLLRHRTATADAHGSSEQPQTRILTRDTLKLL